ncbi:MAG: GNAT family N-acetyltransferase [Bacteroidetes bacterium]|nr:MAG: GNAT family N-acetyltransferase [Bacteroidota bacterium]
MSLQLHTVKNQRELEVIRELYTTAFPIEERRSEEGLAAQLLCPDCRIDVVSLKEEYAGFCIWWQLDGFAFLEHFAINPQMRGRKTGEKVMQKLREMAHGPLLFEIEPPLEGDALRRLQFYLRNGFYLLDKPYRQPSYHGGESLEMKLMSSRDQISDDILEHWVNLVKKRVYNV